MGGLCALRALPRDPSTTATRSRTEHDGEPRLRPAIPRRRQAPRRWHAVPPSPPQAHRLAAQCRAARGGCRRVVRLSAELQVRQHRQGQDEWAEESTRPGQGQSAEHHAAGLGQGQSRARRTGPHEPRGGRQGCEVAERQVPQRHPDGRAHLREPEARLSRLHPARHRHDALQRHGHGRARGEDQRRLLLLRTERHDLDGRAPHRTSGCATWRSSTGPGSRTCPTPWAACPSTSRARSTTPARRSSGTPDSRPWRARRRSPTSGPATACRTATSTASPASRTSCAR